MSTGIPGYDIQISADIVFDNPFRPENIPIDSWRAANKAVYMGMLLGCPMALRHIYSGVRADDGRGMIDKLKQQIGPKQVQIERFNSDVLKNVLADKSHYFTWFGTLNDLFFQFNEIPGLLEQERWSSVDLRLKYVKGISNVFPQVAIIADSAPDKDVEALNTIVEGILNREGIDIAESLTNHSGVQTPSVAGMVSASSTD